MSAVGAVPLQGGDERVLLPEWIAESLGLGTGTLGLFVGALIGAFVIANVLLINAGIVIWAKRKITAAFTDRIAVNRVGPFGLFIIVADAVRLLAKELIVPEGVDRPAWDLGPVIIAGSAIIGFAVIPWGSLGGVEIQLADPEVGLALVFALASVASIGLVMGGYASANKYSMLGSLRAVAQNIAYEIPLILAAASVVLFAGTLQLSGIVSAQADTVLFAVGGLEIPAWFAIVNPFAFVLFLVANLAEVGRNPFDIPEAPTEIVAGHQTEYSSVYFVLIYMGEFIHVFLGGAIAAVVFLGGGQSPFVVFVEGSQNPVLPGPIWFLIKVWGVFLFTQWARAAFPRVRVDQLIEIGWKGLLVLAFANLIVTAVIVGAFAGELDVAAAATTVILS